MAEDNASRGVEPQGERGLSQHFLEALARLPLQAVGDKPDRKLPKGPGEKSLNVRGTEEEAKKLRGYLAEQQAALSGLRVSSRKALSRAAWRPDLKLAVVSIKKGSHWETHGHTHSSQLVLEPHEALFLMEMGCLELEAGGLPMTLQQAYHTLLEEGTLPLQQYMVLASLKRTGYLVHRVQISLHSSQPPPLTPHRYTQTTPTSDEPSSPPPPRLLPSCPACLPSHSPSSQDLQLLEVRQPRKGYRKAHPGPPDFRVCVWSAQDPFPPPSLLARLAGASPPAPLRCCVVDEGGCTAYYSLTYGTVPPP